MLCSSNNQNQERRGRYSGQGGMEREGVLAMAAWRTLKKEEVKMKAKEDEDDGEREERKTNKTLMESNLPFPTSLSNFLRTLAARE